MSDFAFLTRTETRFVSSTVNAPRQLNQTIAASLWPRGFLCVVLMALTGPLMRAGDSAPAVQLTSLPDRVRIEVGGKLFTEYVFSGGPKPYLYPIVAADGTRLTREYPMTRVPGEETDHPHHRSLWFTHGDINGQDFWAETAKTGKVVHEALMEVQSGSVGWLHARNRWKSVEGKLICTDETIIRVQPVPSGRLLDFEITLFAPKDAPITFGDTKEGTMALRLAQWMTLTHEVARKQVPGVGHVLTSAGDRDAAAWGKRAAWVDYFAPHEGKIHGVAMFDHPSNPHHPTWWHVRDYGLFAANPFGRHDFENLKGQPKIGELVVPAGGRVTFRYRIYFHEGDTAAAGVAEQYRAYAAGR